jgi:hypothetical protein
MFCGVRLLHPACFFGTRFLHTKWFCHSIALLFFRTGSESALRTSNPSNRIEATGFAGKKGAPLSARTIVDFVPRA